MKNKIIAHQWVNQSKPNGKGSNFFFERERLYSYGHHFCVAIITPEGVILNDLKVSHSTSCHQSLARQAVSQANLKTIES